MVFLNFSKDVQNDEKFCPPSYIQLSVLTLGNNVKKKLLCINTCKINPSLKKGTFKTDFLSKLIYFEFSLRK